MFQRFQGAVGDVLVVSGCSGVTMRSGAVLRYLGMSVGKSCRPTAPKTLSCLDSGRRYASFKMFRKPFHSFGLMSGAFCPTGRINSF